jgi:hypothetical protein
VQSQEKLPCPQARGPADQADVEITELPASFSQKIYQGFETHSLVTEDFFRTQFRDGSLILGWREIAEFLISADGSKIVCRPSPSTLREEFLLCLLGPVISYSLIRRGIEPFHASAVVINGGAVAFLGDCGYGKSTLTAGFLQKGYSILSDSLLPLLAHEQRIIAHRGPKRIKLFPQSIRATFGQSTMGTLITPRSSKRAIPLAANMIADAAVPLKAVYILRPPRPNYPINKITITTLRYRRAFLDVIANNFSMAIREPDRIKRLFVLVKQIVANTPVRSLTYPRDLNKLSEVIESILSNLPR